MKFAKSTGCFYPDDSWYPNMPGDAVDVSLEEFGAAMARGPGDTIDVIDDRVVVVPKPAPSRADRSAEAWQRIKEKRESVKAGGVKVGAKWFHTDDASRIQHMALNMMGASIPADLQWKTMDGTFVTMTQALAGQVFQAVATLDMAAFAKAEEHRVAMEAAADPSAYDFSAGWPATFAV